MVRCLDPGSLIWVIPGYSILVLHLSEAMGGVILTYLEKKRGLGILLVFAALLLAIAGCGGDDGSAPTAPPQEGPFRPLPTATAPPAAELIPQPTPTTSSASAEAEDGLAKVQLVSFAQNRIIVRTARMSLEVGDVALTIDRIADLADSLGGWVVSSERSSSHSGSIAIRVPAGSLEEAFEMLEAMAVKTVSREVASEDVTDEYVDSQSRLASMRATEQRLLSFLDRAQNVEEALLVQSELAKLQLEIEENEGRLLFLSQTAAYSLIEVSLKLTPVALQVNAGPDSSVRVGQRERFRASFAAPPGIEDFTFVWDFGDGTLISGSGSAPTPNGERVTATVNHGYNDDFDTQYIATIKLTGTGEGGLAEGSDSLLVSVRRVPTIEVFAGDDRTVEEGSKVVYSASFTRPEELWDYEYVWNFGDGSPSLQGVPEEGATRIESAHTFADYRPTAFTVALTISAMSDAGRVSGTDRFSVQVAEAESFIAGGWDVGGTAKAATRALSVAARAVTTGLIWFGIVGTPALLMVVGIAYLRNRSGAFRRLRERVMKVLSGDRPLQG